MRPGRTSAWWHSFTAQLVIPDIKDGHVDEKRLKRFHTSLKQANNTK